MQSHCFSVSDGKEEAKNYILEGIFETMSNVLDYYKVLDYNTGSDIINEGMEYLKSEVDHL